MPVDLELSPKQKRANGSPCCEPVVYPDVQREQALRMGRGRKFGAALIEEIPLPDASVDVVISNCVINLSGDKPRVLREVARVLRPGGRFAVSDVIADEGMDEATRADMQAYTDCIAGALTHREFTQALTDAGLTDVDMADGLTDVDMAETHRVHAQAASAIVRT